MNIQPLIIYYPKEMQMILKDQVVEDQWDFLSTAAAVMICLNLTEVCFPFRDHVRKAAWQAGCRVAHMPGIDLSVLELAEVDYVALRENCEILALALAKGRHISINSHDHLGKKYCLNVELDPWSRMPIISDGIIQKGSWGNVPSGETYIAPLEYLANGEIVIDGSVPGYLIVQGQEVILHFRNGRLMDWTPKDVPAARFLEKLAHEYGEKNHDPGWNVLAEIGLGVNPNVREVTGNALLDEKKYGSVHVAIGDNIDMGGVNKSSIHFDMVSLMPEIRIDDLPILAEGKLTINSGDWREEYRNVRIPGHWHLNTLVQASVIDTEVDSRGQLRRIWHTGSGKVCSVPIGDEASAKLGRVVYKRLGKSSKDESIGNIVKDLNNIPQEDTIKLLYLLQQYHLVNILPDGGKNE
jgi:hypothetical protein